MEDGPADGEVDQNVAKVVRLALKLRDEDQEDLAAVLDVHPSSVSRSLSPKTRRPWSAQDLVRLALHFEIGIDVLVNGDVDQIFKSVTAKSDGS